jgi:hypothetical protein
MVLSKIAKKTHFSYSKTLENQLSY